MGGVYSDVILPIRGLAAGSVHATRELRALMISIFDEVRRQLPSAMITVYVDDTTIECAGTQKTVLETVTAATEMVCSGMVHNGMKLSTTKNVVLSSRKRLGEAIQRKLGRWHVKRSVRGKMLGVGVSGGVRRTTEGMAERAAAFARRRDFFTGLRKMGVDVAKVLRTGGVGGGAIWAGGLWGSGLPPYAAEAQGCRSGGRSRRRKGPQSGLSGIGCRNWQGDGSSLRGSHGPDCALGLRGVGKVDAAGVATIVPE